MAEAKRIAEQHRRAYHGEAWHGPSVFETLRGVTAATAAKRPISGAHTIWELVLHLTSWERIVGTTSAKSPTKATCFWTRIPVSQREELATPRNMYLRR